MEPEWVGPTCVTLCMRPGSYVVRFSDESDKCMHADRLRKYYAQANSIVVIFESDVKFGNIETISECTDAGPRILAVLHDAYYLTPQQAVELGQTLAQHESVLSEKPGRCKIGERKISLIPGVKATKAYPYRVPMALRAKVERQVEELRCWSLVYPIESSFAHLVVCVGKKDGTIRL